MHEQARKWSERLRTETTELEPLIVAAYEQAFARAASEAEEARARDFLEAAVAPGGVGLEQGLADLCHVLFNVKEFVFVR